MELTQNNIKSAIARIESNENKGRKAESYKQAEIYNDRIKQYVVADMRGESNEETIREMPLVSSINVAKRVVNKLASIYKDAPEREWKDLTPEQNEILWNIYHDMGANKKLCTANKFFKLHKQCLLWVVPRNGKLTMRVLRPHQWDVVEDSFEPEKAIAYIISAYDDYNELQESANQVGTATGRQTIAAQSTENYKENIAIKEQEKQAKKRYLVWTKEENYIVDGNGQIASDVIANPLRQFGMMPFVEIADEREFEYWVRQSNIHTNFTVEFNVRMSEVAQVTKMQGFAQAVVKGPKELLMQNFQVGPNYVLKLPVDKDSGIETDFQFVTPNADIAGSIQYLETLLSAYLSCQGIDPTTITLKAQSSNFSSGLERMLSMIENMSASREDYDVFQKVESDLWDLVLAWSVALSNTSTLDQKYKLGAVSMDAEVYIEYAKPEMLKSESDELDIIEREIDLGISSPIRAIMQREEVDLDTAKKLYFEYREETLGGQQSIEVTTEDSPED
ncbi:MAG: hypothetical protein CO099_02650 [Bdellovibrio sp. CG_4_9_14_3_um_filter_39_7]|nr:MAG: hypothetical protein CO099_02650 [Bdellovibrio sp. CG_4_9_14_3_um_filter_39_7]